MTIGSITVDLLARTGSFETDLNRAAKTAEKRAKEIDAAVTKAAAAVGVALGLVSVTTALVVNKNIEAIASFKDLSDKMGDSAEQIATLQTALNLSGTGADTLAAASIKLTSSLSKTDDESKAVGAALKDIGLEFESFKRLSPVAQLDALAKALDTFEDGAGKTAIAVALLGKSGAELLPFLHDLAEGGERQVTLTGEQIAAADDFTKATARLRGEFDLFLQQQTAGIIPALTQVQGLFAELARNQATVESVSAVLNTTIQAATVVFQTLAVVGSDVGFVFLGVGREIGAIIAQLGALARLDYSGFTAISEAVKEDGKRARIELDQFQARVMAVGRPVDLSGNYDDSAARATAKKGLVVTPAKTAGKKDNSAAQEAKAQLTLDLDDIKKSTSLLTDAFDNREKIMSAQRSASLISEADYFAGKRALQVESDQLEQAGIEKQIARLQQEKLTGKDRIDNDRKIADARAALAKARATSATNLSVLDTQAEASAKAIARAFTDARDAAQSFLDVTNRARALEVAGMGRGEKSRGVDSAISQIEEKYEQQRQDLQRDNRNGKFAGRQDDYARELALLNEFQKKSIDSYRDYYDQVELRQKSFSLGASEAARNYLDESQNTFKQTQEAVSSAFKGMEDALVGFVKTGKLDFKSLVDSIITDIARIAIKQQITGPLAGMLSTALGFGNSSIVGASLGNDFIKSVGMNSSGLVGMSGGGYTGPGGKYEAKGIVHAGEVVWSQDDVRNAGGVGLVEAMRLGMRGYSDGGVVGSDASRFTPNTAGAILPSNALGGGGAPVSITNHWSVGDVATQAQLREEVRGSERRMAASLQRSRQYAGSAA